MTADNGQTFQYGYDSTSGKYGYWVKEAGTDVFVPFKSGGLSALKDMITFGGYASQMIALNESGTNYFHTSGNRSDIINRLNNGECDFISYAETTSGTSYMMLVTISKSGYYSFGFENGYNQGVFGYLQANTVHNVSCDFNTLCYYGDSDPTA